MGEGYKAARVVSPGEVMIRELEARGWTQRDLAEIMARPYQAINEIINGSKQITPDTARELAHAFGTSIDFWINLETNYRLHLAEKNEKEKEIVRRSKLYSIAPIREITKRSWIRKTSNLDELEREVCIFLGISSPNDPVLIPVSFRYSEVHEPDVNAQNAWIKRVEHLAESQAMTKFDINIFRESISDVLMYASDEHLLPKLPNVLSKLGIHFLIVPHLSRTFIDGAAITINENPIVALTLRYDRIDSFWFTLMHELAHIHLGHRGIVIDNTEDGQGSSSEKDEHEANELARKWLINSGSLSQFIREIQPHFSKAAIEEFAKENRRHPGIVLGQLQHKNIVGYQHLRALLVKVSPYLSDFIQT